jgi:hypothetical protein
MGRFDHFIAVAPLLCSYAPACVASRITDAHEGSKRFTARMVVAARC